LARPLFVGPISARQSAIAFSFSSTSATDRLLLMKSHSLSKKSRPACSA